MRTLAVTFVLVLMALPLGGIMLAFWFWMFLFFGWLIIPSYKVLRLYRRVRYNVRVWR